MRITSIEIYGFGKFKVPFMLEIDKCNKIIGKSGSGKTVFLKSVAYFFDDSFSSEIGSMISSDNAYVKVSFSFGDKVVWQKKCILSRKTKNIKSEIIYSDNILEDDLLEIEKIKIVYFNNEKYYSEKEDEVKRIKQMGYSFFNERLLDCFTSFEHEVINLKKEFMQLRNIDLDVQFDWKKLFLINLVEEDSFEDYLSTSERKSLLLNLLLRSIDDKTLVLLDDFDVYLDKEKYILFSNEFRDGCWCSISVISKYVNDSVKVVDYKSNRNNIDYIDKYLK